MLFAHDTAVALQAAVNLANSALPPDSLTTPTQLQAFFEEFEYSGTRQGTAAELDAVREVRPRLLELLTADRDSAVEIVNDMLAEAGAVPRLVRHDGWDWHVHAVAQDAPLSTRILVETAMAMIDVIRADEMSRLDRCADEGCTGVVLDLSRNRSRRFCSTACGNRSAQAAHRARQR